MAENRTFTLVGKFDDQISKKLKEINKIFADIQKSVNSYGSGVDSASRSINKMTSSLEDAGKAAGKVRDTVSQIGEGVKGLDGIGESLEAAARAAGRAQDEVLGIGEAAGRANRQADDLMTTLLKAEGLSKFGDAMAQGFSRGMNVVMSTVQKGAGMTAKLFKDAMDDELADIKAASGIQGSFALAGFKGDFRESERMYKKYDQVVSEMIRQSSAPTAKVVELQRYTLDTMGPLMLAAQGVKKGTAMKDIDPKKIQASATQYGQFLEKAALFSQGTGSAGFRVAAGLEGLVTRGKIDTTIDFFTDNIMLMKNLEAAGFAGRGMRSSKLMNATDAQRMAAMMEAFNKSMSSESTKAMASSLTGSLQGLQDTIFNPSVGILGMSVTFSKEEQKKANESIRRIQNERIAGYTRELQSTKTSEERKKQLRINIEQAETTRDQLIKDDVISTPFKAFSYAFSNIVRKLTEALNAIGPVWTNFAVAAIEVTNKVFGPLGETLGNVASDMRAKEVTQAEGFGRIVGEIFKTIGGIMGDLANMINNPDSAMGKVQSEFMKGFMAAFKAPGTLKAAQEGIKNGLSALIGKFFEFLWKAITFEPIRPLMLLFVAGIFGPPLIGAVIAGATPLIISAIGKMVVGSLGRGGGGAGGAAAGLGAFITPGGARAARGIRGAGGFGRGLLGLGYSLAGRPGLRAGQAVGGALGGVGSAVGKVGRYVPGGALAFGALDAGMRMASGQDAGRAIGGAAATTIGATLGGILGQALIPIPGVGAAVGGIAGGIIGDKVGEFFMGPADAQNKAAEAQKFAADAMKSASEKYGPGAEKMGGIEALSRKFGGGAGFSKFLDEQKKAGAITQQQYVDGRVLASQMKTLNIATDKVKSTQLKLSEATNLNTGAQKKIAAELEIAKNKQKTAMDSITKQWSSMDSANRTKILTSAGILASAIDEAAEKIKKNDPNRRGPSGRPLPDSVTGPGSGTPGRWVTTKGGKTWVPGWQGGLGDAISSELRNKPSGSNLVIANSSETIIPAAGGLGMQDFMGVLTSGFNSLGALFKKSEEKSDKNQSDNKDRFTKLDEKLAKLSTGGSMFGMGGPGHVIGVGKALLGMGLQVGMNPFFQYGRGFLPGGGGYIGRHAAGSYHYAGRALDVSGPPGLLDAAYARLRGTNPAELLWRVPGHYDHLHVAYALGAGMPAFFSTQRDAMDWERKATLGNARVSSITSNSSEGMGGGVTVNAPITIHQQPGQNSEQLASLVAMELASAIRQARSSSMYV